MGWKHYQTVDHPKREPQVGSGLFGICLLILHFKFQFCKSIKSSTIHIFLNLTYPLRKISLSKNAQKFTQNRLTVVNKMSIRDLALFGTWPRYWQNGRVLRRQNSLQVYPRLNNHLRIIRLRLSEHWYILTETKSRWIFANVHWAWGE